MLKSLSVLSLGSTSSNISAADGHVLEGSFSCLFVASCSLQVVRLGYNDRLSRQQRKGCQATENMRLSKAPEWVFPTVARCSALSPPLQCCAESILVGIATVAGTTSTMSEPTTYLVG